MDSAEQVRGLDGTPPNADVPTEGQTPTDSQLKRKASLDEQDGSPKRTRRDEDRDDASSYRPRRDSSLSRGGFREGSTNANHDRRMSATQEEKKRGKRLFGGLLNTLSQTPSNPQQKRRQEIERRQHARLQKQKDEDKQNMSEKLGQLRKHRMAEQIVFDEEVMLRSHSKILSTARFLKTRSEPQIFYLPWKLTEKQELQIDDQIRAARERIQRELAAFKVKKERHVKEHGPSQRKPQGPSVEIPEAATSRLSPVSRADDGRNSSQDEKASEKEGNEETHRHDQKDHDDDSADVLEEADGDMVIY